MNQRYRKVLIFFFFLFAVFNSSWAFAVSKVAEYDYKKYWTEHKIENPEASIRLFTKNSPIKELGVIATVTISENNSASKDEVFGVMKRTLDKAVWSEDKIEGIDFIEAVDVSSVTLYRIGYNQNTKQFSIASVRTRNLLPSYLEMHLMQIEKLTGKKSTSSAHFLYDLLMAKAFAQNVPSGPEIRGAVADLGREIMQPTADAGRQVSGSVREFSSKLSTENIAKLAAVGALASTLTSALATFAINGTWELAKKLYYEVTGQFTSEEKRVKVELFEKSFAAFADLSPKLEDLNRRIDVFSSVLNLLSKKGSSEAVLSGLDQAIRAKKQAATEAGLSCTSGACLSQEATLEIKALEDIRDVIFSAGKDVLKGKEAICRQIDSFYMAYASVELNITKAREFIIENTPVFLGAVSQMANVTIEKQDQRKPRNACLEPIESQRSRLSSSAREQNCDDPNNSSKKTCRIWVNLKKQEELCLRSEKEVVVKEDLLASLSDSALAFNSNILHFSSMLSNLDCSKTENGRCVLPGPYAEIKSHVQSKLQTAGQECKDSIFTKSFSVVETIPLANKRTVASEEKKSSSSLSGGGLPLSLWQRIKAFMGKPQELVEESNRWHQDMYGGG